MQIDGLLSVGIVILIGLLGGKLSHKYNIPRVTGYMLIGLLFGPSVFGLLSSELLSDIHLINDIALGLILFAIGGEIELHHIKAMGKKVVFIAIAESLGAFALIFGVTMGISGDLGLASLLGTIAIATAPGVTLLVIREYSARGPLTETLLAVVAMNNVICLVAFRLFFSAYSLANGAPMLDVAFDVFKELVLSVVIGLGLGGLITYWEKKIDDLSELVLVIIGTLLLGIGISTTIGISQLLVCLIIGAVTNNLSMMHKLVYPELRQTEMPFYIAFFVLSGASLHLDSLAHLGLLGVAYLVARPLGKFIGSHAAGVVFKANPQVINNLGMALLPQAGVAIGLAMEVSQSHPELGGMISTVVLSSVIVYEGIGPFLTRLALVRARETHSED